MMVSKGQKLLERIKNSKSGCKRRDLVRLYKAFGFIIVHGKKHDIAKHPDYPQLRGTIARHNELASGYFQHAVKMIEMLEEMKEVEK
jgi:hypothetical protein